MRELAAERILATIIQGKVGRNRQPDALPELRSHSNIELAKRRGRPAPSVALS